MLERTFAEALGVSVGGGVTLNGHSFEVTGIAGTAAGLETARVLSALPGAILGVPLGIALFKAAAGGSDPVPPAWCLAAAVLGTLVVVAGLTTIPARIGTRRSVTEALQSEGA